MDTRNWKWFRYDQIFDIKKGKRLTKADMIEGEIPYIGAIDSNNGVSAHISNSEHLHSANTITVSYNGSIGYAYYQQKEFWATDDVNVLYPKFKLNKYVAEFLCSLIEKEQYRFCYGRKWDKETMKKSMIKLPVDKSGSPDWQWIENYVKETIIPNLPSKTQSVWQNEFDKSPLSSNKLQLNTAEWRWFRVGDLFNRIYKGSAYNSIDLIECSDIDPNSIAYITRTDSNNGCKGYVLNEDFQYIETGNAITIGDTTATIYYQENEFICGDHMIVLRSENLNKWVGIFLVSILSKERYRYCYGRAFKKDIIFNTQIKLPCQTEIDDKGEQVIVPDWQFMEDYIKRLPYSKCL